MKKLSWAQCLICDVIFMPVQFYLTDAGRIAALDAEALDINLSLSHVAVGTGQYDAQAAAPAKTALTTEVARFPLNGGSVETVSGSLRLVASIDATVAVDGTEIGLFTDAGVLFAIAATTGSTPLLKLIENITAIVTFGLSLVDFDVSAITISIDPNTPISVALMNQHLANADPHAQYLTKARATVNGVDANLAATNNLGNDVAPYYKDLNLVFTTGKFWVDSRCTNTPQTLTSSLYPADLDDVYGVLTVAVADGTSSAAYFYCYQQLQTTTHIWTRRYLSTSASSQSTGTWTDWTCGVSINRALANGIDADLFAVANVTTGDFDDLLDVGEYSCNDMSGHTPYAGAYGLLKVWRSGANVYQIFQSNSGLSGLWHRAYDSTLNSWIAWQRAASAADLSGEVTRAEGAEAALLAKVGTVGSVSLQEQVFILDSQVASLIANTYPKIIAAGHSVMSGVDDTLNTTWTSVIYAPSGVDLTNTSKWVVRWNTLGAGNDNNSNVRWSTALYAGYFVAKSYLADTSSVVVDGVGIMTYEIVQISE